MALWKTLLLVGVVVLAWFFAHRYFDLVMLIAGILWVTEYFRSRQMGEGGERPVPVDDLARRLGIPVRTGQRSVKARWNDVLVQLSAVEVTAGTRRLTVYDLASPTFRKAPFCFVIRPRKAVIREADLVENSRIPGIKFEYQLRRVELPPPLEAAANLPDLFLDMPTGPASIGGATAGLRCSRPSSTAGRCTPTSWSRATAAGPPPRRSSTPTSRST